MTGPATPNRSGILARLWPALGMGGPAAVAPPAQDARHRRHLAAATRSTEAAMDAIPGPELLKVIEFHLIDRDDITGDTLADFAKRLAWHADRKHPAATTSTPAGAQAARPTTADNMKTANMGTQAAKGVAACNPRAGKAST